MAYTNLVLKWRPQSTVALIEPAAPWESQWDTKPEASVTEDIKTLPGYFARGVAGLVGTTGDQQLTHAMMGPVYDYIGRARGLTPEQTEKLKTANLDPTLVTYSIVSSAVAKHFDPKRASISLIIINELPTVSCFK